MANPVVHKIRASGMGGDYLSLSAWEAAEQRNLVTADEIAVAECYDDWPSGLDDAVTIAGWSTNSSCYIIVRAAPGHDHGGVPNTGFRLVKHLAHNPLINTSQSYTRVERIGVIPMSGNGHGIWSLTTDATVVFDSVITGRQGVVSLVGFRTRRAVIRNCLAIGHGDGFWGNEGYYGPRWQNCVAHACTRGFRWTSGGSNDINQGAWIRNCVAHGNTTNFNITSTIYAAGSGNNAASSGTPPGADPYPVATVAADFVDAANDDFHLSASSGLRGQGANLYSDFQYDIDGDLLPAVDPWDIGFDYYNETPVIQSYSYATTGSSVSSITVAKPEGLAEGDLMVGLVGQRNGGRAASFPAGWTEIYDNGSLSNGSFAVGWKIADSSDVAASDFTFGVVGHFANSTAGVILRVTGAHTIAPINASAGSATFSATPGTSPSVTTNVNNALALLLVYTNEGSDITFPSGVVAHIEQSANQEFKWRVGIQNNAIARSTGAFTWSAVDGLASAWYKVTAAIAPAVSAPAYTVTLSNPLAAANGQNGWSGSCDVAYA